MKHKQLKHPPAPPDARPATIADTDGRLDWTKVIRLAWRPAWSIRSRRGSVAPFVDMIAEAWRSWRVRGQGRGRKRGQGGPAS